LVTWAEQKWDKQAKNKNTAATRTASLAAGRKLNTLHLQNRAQRVFYNFREGRAEVVREDTTNESWVNGKDFHSSLFKNRAQKPWVDLAPHCKRVFFDDADHVG
jgi:hypothetical protein